MTATEKSSQNPKYKRIILKLSGEVLRNNEDGEPIDPSILKAICEEVKKVYDIGVEIGLVIGGGNIFRGLSGAEMKGVDRTTGDYMGMLVTSWCSLRPSTTSLSDYMQVFDADKNRLF